MAANPSLRIAASWCCRLLLGGTFAFAAVTKILDPQAFVTDIGHYRLLPHPLTIALGLYLPWLELACALGVLGRWRERGALALLLGLCGLFSLALASAWWRGLDIECGCFGHGAASTILPVAFVRSMVLGLVALFLLRTLTDSKLAEDDASRPNATPT